MDTTQDIKRVHTTNSANLPLCQRLLYYPNYYYAALYAPISLLVHIVQVRSDSANYSDSMCEAPRHSVNDRV